ncbi:GNAT family N-acetyltransferase [uncultured Methanobrevibacter sp.]|jgi:GNAT superfamily N-acetyltransferase|uniref:GNAT family N-acetyltransferase n=1 Tax=uncultured Methanobrevibacter sp. TaxID=253161 RepID=UPI0025E5A7E4|nr:GNAT family N-acetyltransferase [uncultured Methanobrevibacter sp.]MEE1134281.1 GNAT family N-acetyltransferase [Methanobrevibacter sp.]MEE3489329.1 GNAT family N-acetyltransferase [Methanobrevibacter sp.]
MRPKITYKNTHKFSKKELEDLFLSVEWSSGEYPEKLVIAMRNFNTVFSAWDGEDLVGLISVMDDGIMNAYIHYLLVKPDYQLKGIGKELVERVKKHYDDYLRIVVICENKNVKFYEYCGFENETGKSPLFITDLEN